MDATNVGIEELALETLRPNIGVLVRRPVDGVTILRLAVDDAEKTDPPVPDGAAAASDTLGLGAWACDDLEAPVEAFEELPVVAALEAAPEEPFAKVDVGAEAAALADGTVSATGSFLGRPTPRFGGAAGLGAGGGVDDDDGLPGFLKAAAAFLVNRTAVRRLTPAGEPLDEL